MNDRMNGLRKYNIVDMMMLRAQSSEAVLVA